jgi:hypothetical protein
MQIVGIAQDGIDAGNHSHGHDYLLTDSGNLVANGAAHSAGTHISGGSRTSAHGPTSTLVGTGNLEINLVWDSSVRTSSNWSAIETAIVDAAKIYVSSLTSDHPVVINIGVGYGEVGGTRMSASALGESESYGNFYNYSTVQTALNSADAGLTSVPTNDPTTSNNFFVTTAEAKALDLMPGTSTAIDGYIGISKSSSINFSAALTGSTIGSSQYDGVGIAAHEISEVMGRLGMEGLTLGTVQNVYTPLDLFRYTSPGVLDLTPTTGYFSINGGVTNLGTYNNPANGGDAADWASSVVNDAYDAFGTPGTITNVSSSDLTEVAALGYKLVNSSPVVA